MPPSARRSQKSRRDARPSPGVDSSPSQNRPAKRRRKTIDEPAPAPAPAPVSAPDVADDDDSALTADQSGFDVNDADQLVSRTVQHLIHPRDAPVQASKDHANSIHEANKDGVKAYAKIAAPDWTYYVTHLEVKIGRSSDPPAAAEERDNPDGSDNVHIDLGPSKTVSRQHATIYFDPKVEQWFLRVSGRNGAKIDSTPLRQGASQALKSGEVMEIGGVEMMFVLPTEISPLYIHSSYLQRAGIPPSSLPSPLRRASQLPGSTGAPESSQIRSGTDPGASSQGPQQQPIAPAPPDYQRPGTPPSTRRRTAAAPSSQVTTPRAPGLSALLGPYDIDLSKDENKHIKPQFSYAQMITQAIIRTADEKLNLNGIYNYITTNYAYYRHQPAAGWQNSIRHNLSLNKSFDKVARSTDEPGKGMKWQIVPEAREEMVRTAYKGGRGGHRGSSAPSSPSQLNYITQGPRDMANARDSPSGRKRRLSPIASPSARSSFALLQSTPERSGSNAGSLATTLHNDGSPLPRQKKSGLAPSSSFSAFQQPQSPTLTSSYLHDENPSFVTPAPPRIHPRLAPPSTAQRPSQHMPTSSPAPFWKYVDINSTPLKPTSQFDASPSKFLTGTLPQSSSPPARLGKSPVTSPSKPGKEERQKDGPAAPDIEDEEEQVFDLAKGFQSIGSYHAPVGRGLPVADAGDS